MRQIDNNALRVAYFNSHTFSIGSLQGAHYNALKLFAHARYIIFFDIDLFCINWQF